jgi:hypothetical protein
MPYTAHPLPLPPLAIPEPQTQPHTSFDPVEFLQRLFDEPQREAQRRLDAVKRRREFRLIQGNEQVDVRLSDRNRAERS